MKKLMLFLAILFTFTITTITAQTVKVVGKELFVEKSTTPKTFDQCVGKLKKTGLIHTINGGGHDFYASELVYWIIVQHADGSYHRKKIGKIYDAESK